MISTTDQVFPTCLKSFAAQMLRETCKYISDLIHGIFPWVCTQRAPVAPGHALVASEQSRQPCIFNVDLHFKTILDTSSVVLGEFALPLLYLSAKLCVWH